MKWSNLYKFSHLFVGLFGCMVPRKGEVVCKDSGVVFVSVFINGGGGQGAEVEWRNFQCFDSCFCSQSEREVSPKRTHAKLSGSTSFSLPEGEGSDTETHACAFLSTW